MIRAETAKKQEENTAGAGANTKNARFSGASVRAARQSPCGETEKTQDGRQDMADLGSIRYKRQQAINRRERLREELRELERSYDTLVEFNKSAAGCRGSFESVNGAKASALAEIQAIQENCRTAKEYFEGMNGVLNNKGGKLVILAYTWLLNRSKSKLESYLQRIAEVEDEIAECTRQIESYTYEINRIEQQLEEDGVVGG